jgi:Arc/MetJ family transcription regulator
MHIMRTSIDIDESLMSKALKAGRFRTKREAVEEGLRLVVKMRAQEELRDLFGKIDWQGDLDAMRRDN